MTLIEAAALHVKTERVIAERDGRGWLVMWPDGNVAAYANKRQVLRAVRDRIGKADAMVTEMEWRS